MKLKNRKYLYWSLIFLTIFSGIFVDTIITALLSLVLFLIIYFDKEFRKETPFQSKTLLFGCTTLNVLFIFWLVYIDCYR